MDNKNAHVVFDIKDSYHLYRYFYRLFVSDKTDPRVLARNNLHHSQSVYKMETKKTI